MGRDELVAVELWAVAEEVPCEVTAMATEDGVDTAESVPAPQFAMYASLFAGSKDSPTSPPAVVTLPMIDPCWSTMMTVCTGVEFTSMTGM